MDELNLINNDEEENKEIKIIDLTKILKYDFNSKVTFEEICQKLNIDFKNQVALSPGLENLDNETIIKLENFIAPFRNNVFYFLKNQLTDFLFEDKICYKTFISNLNLLEKHIQIWINLKEMFGINENNKNKELLLNQIKNIKENKILEYWKDNKINIFLKDIIDDYTTLHKIYDKYKKINKKDKNKIDNFVITYKEYIGRLISTTENNKKSFIDFFNKLDKQSVYFRNKLGFQIFKMLDLLSKKDKKNMKIQKAFSKINIKLNIDYKKLDDIFFSVKYNFNLNEIKFKGINKKALSFLKSKFGNNTKNVFYKLNDYSNKCYGNILSLDELNYIEFYFEKLYNFKNILNINENFSEEYKEFRILSDISSCYINDTYPKIKFKNTFIFETKKNILKIADFAKGKIEGSVNKIIKFKTKQHFFYLKENEQSSSSDIDSFEKGQFEQKNYFQIFKNAFIKPKFLQKNESKENLIGSNADKLGRNFYNYDKRDFICKLRYIGNISQPISIQLESPIIKNELLKTDTSNMDKFIPSQIGLRKNSLNMQKSKGSKFFVIEKNISKPKINRLDIDELTLPKTESSKLLFFEVLKEHKPKTIKNTFFRNKKFKENHLQNHASFCFNDNPHFKKDDELRTSFKSLDQMKINIKNKVKFKNFKRL